MAKQTKKVIKLKQPLAWHYASMALESLHLKSIMNEKEYEKYFIPLESFVDEHITIPKGFDVTNIYVVCECVETDDKTARR